MKSTKNIRQCSGSGEITEDTNELKNKLSSLFGDKQGTDHWPY
ncbi:hypothetical protein CHCC20375_3687 [Bacillus licheniformis]|nr:hypothetical protein CHCC20375_3687 [Bacillus licheniformis]